MKALIVFCSFCFLGIGGAISAENNATTFHVQLIRGTEDAKPREASWKPVSAKVNKKLSAAFSTPTILGGQPGDTERQ